MPDWTGHLRKHLAGLQLSPTREAEIIEELSQHLEERYEEIRADGANDVESCRLALSELTDRGALADQMRSLRQAHVPPVVPPGVPAGVVGVEGLWNDIRYGVRALTGSPASRSSPS